MSADRYERRNHRAHWVRALLLGMLALVGGNASVARAQDCNGNGLPDDQELLACPGAPNCDDCNRNGLLDECDILDGASRDDNLDGVPDECAIARNSGNWTDDIWNLAGLYPDNVDGVPGLHVSIPFFNIFLNETVEIESLRLLGGATLRVTQTGVGDLIINPASPGGLLILGNLLTGSNRVIAVEGGPVVIGEAGRYAPETATGALVSSTLLAQRVTLLPTFCGETEQMTLSDNMSVQSAGDFIMDGSGSIVCPSGGLGGVAGGKTPPILKSGGSESELAGGVATGALTGEVDRLILGGSFRMVQAAEVCVGCTPATQSRTPRIVVAGDFDNHSVRPSIFHWPAGRLLLAGTAPHLFEVGGLDLGVTPAGFHTAESTLFDAGRHTNFSMATVEVAAGGDVTFTNQFANTAGATACGEALYVEQLVLGAGSTVHLDNTRVYYGQLVDLGGNVQRIGCGDLVAVDLNVPTVSTWGLAIIALSLLAAASVIVRRSPRPVPFRRRR